ncbi:exotoxin beta-grasp domain-containing protein [Staphylococcus aureus]
MKKVEAQEGSEKKHEIDLSEKVSFDRMCDVLDSKQMKNIEVNLN